MNYGDGLVPLDKLFGAWHDGSPEARMNVRYEKRKARLNAVKAAG